jgi:polysaccharide export outer membrane protein
VAELYRSLLSTLKMMIPRPYYKVIAVFLLAMMVAGACATGTAPEATVSTVRGQSIQSSASEINRALATLARSTSTISGDYRIGPEDLLQITLYNVTGDTTLTPSSDARLTPRTTVVRVSQQGLLSLPLLGEIKVSGMTASELESTLRKKYDQYIYQPQVGVLVTEYKQRVSVIGAAVKTGVFELTGPKTVIDILAMAGGVTEKAGTQVHIYRQGPNGRETHVIDLLALASNASLINADNAGLITMPVQAGDVINIPPAGTFFVDGAVRKPGPYPLGRRYSLSQALATAGGVDPELNSSDITIFRRKAPSGMEPISIDYAAVLAGSAVDPQIEEDDVIVVPMSSTKYFVKRFIGSLVGGISLGSFIHGS